MRLSVSTVAAIERTVNAALSGECVVTLRSQSYRAARDIFDACSKHIEGRGGVPDRRGLLWSLPNGSLIRIEVDAVGEARGKASYSSQHRAGAF